MSALPMMSGRPWPEWLDRMLAVIAVIALMLAFARGERG